MWKRKETKRGSKGCVVMVEGNIAAGKSTLLKKLVSRYKNTKVYEEIVNDDLLAALYDSPKALSFATQLYMLKTRLSQLSEARACAVKGTTCFMDRGTFGDGVFALTNHSIGNMTDLEMKLYRSIGRDVLPATLTTGVDLLVYLNASPGICYSRATVTRKRKSERKIPFTYLKALSEMHFHTLIDWMGSRKSPKYALNLGKPVDVLICDWGTFGNEVSVWNAINDVIYKKRRCPSISFVDGVPSCNAIKCTIIRSRFMATAKKRFSVPVVKNTQTFDMNPKARYGKELHIHAGFNALRATGCPTDWPDVTSVAFNWSLRHGAKYIALVMYYLSTGGHVTFYSVKKA